ncbi:MULTISPECIES: glycoside hydrolase family protein [unclassified Microcoleus]|uniref:glycoside hydrolase family protein n=1 Tax=unclassified Microcoleus TaxID=2642155 RepID=UPI002FD5F9DF
MKPSNECFELIKKWEGLHKKLPDGRIQAYRDPVRIWTIGYGSIEHLDRNRPILEGDIITREAAERWLQIEVAEKAEDVDRLCQVKLQQCMFDALVSFTYNIGIGAFGKSTLLRELNKGNYEGSAREFDRWVNGEDNGTRRPLPGLINRRNDEEALFRRDGFLGLDSAIGFVTKPEDLAQPPKGAFPYKPASVPLPFTRTLEKGHIGEDCYILNCALAGLKFLRLGSQLNEFTDITDSAVKLFQTREALSRVDGKVGPETRRAIENALRRARGEHSNISSGIDGRVYCRLTRTRRDAYAGLEWCKLDFVNPQGNVVVDSLDVISGVPAAQRFLMWDDPESKPRNLAPIPQDNYYISDIDWADGKDNYNASHPIHGDGLGPVWVSLVKPQERHESCRLKEIGCRDAFGFHADWNWIQSRTSPGSAGCACVTTIDDLRKLVKLLRKYDPRLLVVDWGL